MESLEALRINPDIVLGVECLAVSYVRDVREGSEAERVRHAPTAVELRVDLKRCEAFDEEQRAKLLSHPDIQTDRRGTMSVICSEYRSRKQNLAGARQIVSRTVRHALQSVPVVTPPPPAPEPRPEIERLTQGVIRRRREPS